MTVCMQWVIVVRQIVSIRDFLQKRVIPESEVIMSRKKTKAEPREIYSFRISRDEKEKLYANAKTYGVSPSEYLRAVAVSGNAYDPKLSEDRQKLLEGISRIGNNINQIARWANTNQTVSQDTVENVWGELISIHKLISLITGR